VTGTGRLDPSAVWRPNADGPDTGQRDHGSVGWYRPGTLTDYVTSYAHSLNGQLEAARGGFKAMEENTAGASSNVQRPAPEQDQETTETALPLPRRPCRASGRRTRDA